MVLRLGLQRGVKRTASYRYTRRVLLLCWSCITHAPRLFVLLGPFGFLAGLGALAQALSGGLSQNVPAPEEHAFEVRAAIAFIGLLMILQGILIVARHRWGLHLVMLWGLAVPLLGSAWSLLSEGRFRLDVLPWVAFAGICWYTWHNRWWFQRDRCPESLPAPSVQRSAALIGVDAVAGAQDYAVFRSLYPESCRRLPPFFYQFIAAGFVFGLLGLVAAVTVLPILATDSGSPLARAGPWTAGAFGALGVLQALAVLRRHKWALWAVNAWFVAAAGAAWVYLPALAEPASGGARFVGSVVVTVMLGFCSYYFWNRRGWFPPRTGSRA